jgi:hypothetical protein
MTQRGSKNVNLESYLKKLKRDLAKMIPDPVDPDCDPCDRACFVCGIREMPIDRALVAAIFMGRDLAVETERFREHIIANHICEVHFAHVKEILKFSPGWTKT